VCCVIIASYRNTSMRVRMHLHIHKSSEETTNEIGYQLQASLLWILD
jgi:hypothetical protein